MDLPNSEQHIIDVRDIQRSVFCLLNLSAGFSSLLEDDIFSQYAKECDSSILFSKYSELFEIEATSLLLKIAINCRVLDDQLVQNNSSIEIESFVGEIILGNLEVEKNEEYLTPKLSLRECFNKIIHATHIEHDIRPGGEINGCHYMPEVHLLGSQGKKKWSASVYLLPFCHVAFELLEACMPNNHSQRD